jgi:gliotoxin/aspirochlorine biosynthesis thioredoxin reductase
MPAPNIPKFNFGPAFLFDAIIIGAGPAGLSAALAMSRQKRPAVVFSDSKFRNVRAQRAHTVLSRDHMPAAETRRIGREQIEAYGTTFFVEHTVQKARKNEKSCVFEVVDAEGETWQGKKIVLAMGARDIFPDIDGYADCWGESIYQCMFCDGLERSDKPAAMLGFESAAHQHVLGFIFAIGCTDVTILSDGPLEPKDDATKLALEIAKAKGTKIDERKIKKLVHLPNEEGIEVQFAEGSNSKFGFIQHSPLTEVVARNLAEELGVEVQPDGRGGTQLKRNEPFGETNVQGVFTAGDAGTWMKQFTMAMAHGTSAGAGVCFQLGHDEDEKIAEKLREKSGRL